jgi:hypothetical protein
MKETKKAISWIWILSLFLSPIIGLLSILVLSYYELGRNIKWDATFTGKPIKK